MRRTSEWTRLSKWMAWRDVVYGAFTCYEIFCDIQHSLLCSSAFVVVMW